MSFVTYRPSTGFGGVDPTLLYSQLTSGGALGLAAKSVLTDPSLVGPGGVAQSASSVLSPFSVINLSMLSGALSAELEQGVETVANEVISALPDAILSTVSTLISDVMDIVPVIGPIFKVMFDGIAMAFAGGGPAYLGSAQEQQDCQAFMQYFKAPASGGGLDPCRTCPSDLFYPSVPTQMSAANNYPVAAADSPPQNSANPCGPGRPWGDAFCNNFKPYGQKPTAWNTAAGVNRTTNENVAPRSFEDLDFYKVGPNWELNYAWRPALGQALMLATEGGLMDAFEVMDPTQRIAYANWQDQNYDLVRGGFTAYLALKGRGAYSMFFATYGGVPPQRRAQFRALRRGIQYCAPQYARAPQDKRDAGVSLWPVYMDLLLNAYDTGQLNDEFVGYCLTYQALLGAINYGGAFPISHAGGGYLADARGNLITPQHLNGLLLNQNLFGRGYVMYGGGSIDISVCAQNAASQIAALVSDWRHTTENTATLQGTQKLAQYAAQAKAIASGLSNKRVLAPAWSIPQMTAIRPSVPVVKKAHGSAALMGAAAAAAAIYLLL